MPAQGVSLDQIEEALDAVLAGFIASGPAEEEVARVKRLGKAARIFAQDDQSSLARLYGAALTVGRTVAEVQAWPDVLDSVTPEDVRAAAEKHLVVARSVTGRLNQAEVE